MRCDNCGAAFPVKMPAIRTEYDLIMFSERNRTCPKCAQLPGRINAEVNKKWSPSGWKPENHDKAGYIK